MATTADYTGSRYDVRIVKGDDVSETFSFRDSDGEPLDLTGYSFQSQVRETPESAVIGTFTCTPDLAESTVTRLLVRAVTSDMEGNYYHDMQWTDPAGLVKTLIQGRFIVVPEITRD